MFERGDEQYLIRAANKNILNLFLGSGFSLLAKNKLGNRLPTGWEFAELLWDFLGYGGKIDNSTTLSELYEALLASGKPVERIKQFMEENLTCSDVPVEYQSICNIFWYRIYTTNIDDLLTRAYAGCTYPKLDVVSYPNDEVSERDVTLDRVQAVYLHGRLPCAPSDVTFSISQFARRATPHDHLYDHFVRDYATKPTIFIGTSLNEPLLWQYIEIRKARGKDIKEERPKSFLICPDISAPKRQLLEAMNVVPVIGSTSDFLRWLESNRDSFSSREDVLRVTVPGLIELVGKAKSGIASDRRAVEEFARYFHSVPVEGGQAEKRSLYLLGASPKWEDILKERDAGRSVTAEIQEKVEACIKSENKAISLISILGSAGCGKSTILRRLAVSLARSGYSCFLTNSEGIARFEDVARALTSIGKQCILFFDNAEVVLPALPRLLAELEKIEFPPIILIASRLNEFERVSPRLPDSVRISEFVVPNLNRQEIKNIIEILDVNGLLGNLKGMSERERVSVFESKANKQILVAMREATSGKGFDEIIEDEYSSLVPDESKILYLCVALATESGYRLTIQEFVGCSRVSPAECLSILSRNLRDIVLRTGVNDDLLMLRHRSIAEYVVDRFSPRDHLREAYLRLLDVLSSEMGGRVRSPRNFGLYKSLIKHHTVVRRFENSVSDARYIFDSLMHRFSNNAQFLLQYGSLEMEAGELEVAQNYFDQADSLEPGNSFIFVSKGHLLLKKALKAKTKASAITLREDGSKILLDHMSDPEVDDAFCYHIYCLQSLQWIRVWCGDLDEKRRELELLRPTVNRAFRLFPRDRRIEEIKLEFERDYFSIAVQN